MPPSVLELRPAVIEDAALVADLDTLALPDEARDPVMMAFWWTHQTAGERAHRLISTDGGVARVFVYAGHSDLNEDPKRFGSLRVRIHPDHWSEAAYRECIAVAESWLRGEGAATAVAKVREDEPAERRLLESIGYREDRRYRTWRLDLVEGRERLLATAEATAASMRRAGVELMTLDRDADPERMRKLYELDIETTNDIPTTVPIPTPTFDEWNEFWFDNPAHTPGRFWIARDGDAIVGLSVIGFPPRRGIPWTSFTCTARSARGRGIGRALKYASVRQAIELGATVVETQNDAANAPILHLNEEMGYRPFKATIEMHRKL